MSDDFTETKVRWPNYATVWRWHFYAGLFCLPFVIVLSVTGTIYLFRPQIDAWQERRFDRLPVSATTETYSAQCLAATDSIDGAKLAGVEAVSEPPENEDFESATRVLVQNESGDLVRVYVDPRNAKVLGSVDENNRFTRVVRQIHGELLLGKRGSYLVELVASWTIVMVVTGIVLWTPRRFRIWGVLLPRLGSRGKTFWKDMHSVGGLWVSLLIVFLIATGLPWSTFWGDYFKQLRHVTGTDVAHQHWDGGHAVSKAAVPPRRTAAPDPRAYSIEHVDEVIQFAKTLGWLPPVVVDPPSGTTEVWTIKSTTPNRPYQQSLKYDRVKRAAVQHDKFADRHWVDQMVGQGIALHEGQRFNQFTLGWINQMLALMATAGLVMLSCTGLILWWRRRDRPGLSPPAKSDSSVSMRLLSRRRTWMVLVVMILLAAYLPLFGISAIIIVLLDRTFLARSELCTTYLR